MRHSPNRREFLHGLLKAAAALGLAPLAAAAGGLPLGKAAPFSFDALKAEAVRLAGLPFRPPRRPAPALTAQINYEQWGQIAFDTDNAIRVGESARFPVEFFHLGMFFQQAVQVFVVDGGEAREVRYDPRYFKLPADALARRLPPDAGFAGLRVKEPQGGELDWRKNDWVAFLGASYFRAIGGLRQYGLSARGVALDTWQAGKAEEFPAFTAFYLGPETADGLVLHALLEGPSVTGAYRFVLQRGAGVVMDIDCELHLRAKVERFGLAPLTSMFWFGETVKAKAVDWRPEIHDSDGLALWTGSGERIWRPLNNPAQVAVSAFGDEHPRGFGLLQRDRNFDHYQDGVHYDRRPSVWVEPRGDWGKGAVQLIEIPTDDEIHDNIVAAWVPARPAEAGSTFTLAYRLHWLADEPYPTPLARCVATRLGNGGQPGLPRPAGVRKFMVEFLGEPLTRLAYGEKPEAVLWASRGSFSYVFTEAVPNDVPGHWRAQFDLTVAGPEPVEMRLFLRLGETVLSETWLYQYHPF